MSMFNIALLDTVMEIFADPRYVSVKSVRFQKDEFEYKVECMSYRSITWNYFMATRMKIGGKRGRYIKDIEFPFNIDRFNDAINSKPVREKVKEAVYEYTDALRLRADNLIEE